VAPPPAASAGVEQRAGTAGNQADGYLEESGAVHDVPPVVRTKALEVGARAWLDGLPTLVAALERDWSIRVGPAYADATEAFVAEATTADGTPAVLKLVVPRDVDAAAHEITVLRLCGGEGCAALLRHDAGRGALLLEQLGPSLFTLGRPLAERHEVLCAAARRVWRPAAGAGLPTGADKARWLAAWITRAWEDLGRPCSLAAVDDALACADRRARAHDPGRAVLVHGDVHQWNALGAPEGYKLVDPDGLEAEPEYDLGIIMREDPVELLRGDPMGRAEWLAARSGLDATAIWEWGVVERVSTGLLGTQVGLQPMASQMLGAADAVAR
jgi:streptomycin 6-kinase